MKPDEYEMLFKMQAKADEELRLYQKLLEERQPVEPVEAIPFSNYDLENIAGGLKGIAQDMSEYHAEYNENRRADAIKAEKEKKQSLRHNLFVATFSVALTLFFEHFHDIIEFVLKFFRSFF